MSRPQRADLVAEKIALDERLGALGAYLYGSQIKTVDSYEIERLERQRRFMQLYSSTLAERIAAYGDHC